MKPIAWFSRHVALPAQEAELRRLGLWPIIYDREPLFTGPEDIVARFKRTGAADMVIVAPQSMVAKLIELGIRPIWSEMVPVDVAFARQHPDSCVVMEVSKDARNTRNMKDRPRERAAQFVRFRRLTAIEMKFEDIEVDEPAMVTLKY